MKCAYLRTINGVQCFLFLSFVGLTFLQSCIPSRPEHPSYFNNTHKGEERKPSKPGQWLIEYRKSHTPPNTPQIKRECPTMDEDTGDNHVG